MTDLYVYNDRIYISRPHSLDFFGMIWYFSIEAMGVDSICHVPAWVVLPYGCPQGINPVNFV